MISLKEKLPGELLIEYFRLRAPLSIIQASIISG